MTSDSTHQELLTHLQQLEAELQAQQLWSSSPPSATALESVMPFMYDTLKLHEWLQWVFLPRLRAVIDAKGQLPHESHIHPLAEHEWQEQKTFDKRQLLSLLASIDASLNGGQLTPVATQTTRH